MSRQVAVTTVSPATPTNLILKMWSSSCCSWDWISKLEIWGIAPGPAPAAIICAIASCVRSIIRRLRSPKRRAWQFRLTASSTVISGRAFASSLPERLKVFPAEGLGHKLLLQLEKLLITLLALTHHLKLPFFREAAG